MQRPAGPPAPAPAAPARRTPTDELSVSRSARVPAADPLASYPVAADHRARQAAAIAACRKLPPTDRAAMRAALAPALADDPTTAGALKLAGALHAAGLPGAGKLVVGDRLDALLAGPVGQVLKTVEPALEARMRRAYGSGHERAQLEALVRALGPRLQDGLPETTKGELVALVRAMDTLDQPTLPASDPRARRAQAIVDRLAPGAFHVVLVQDAVRDAANLGGNELFVNTGMMDSPLSDDALAGVFGHEITHFLRGDLLGGLGSLVVQGRVEAWLAPQAKGGAQAGNVQHVKQGLKQVDLTLRREQEARADADGARIAAKAGYDPRAFANYFRALAAHDTPASIAASDHPGGLARATALDAEIAREKLAPARPAPAVPDLFGPTAAERAAAAAEDESTNLVMRGVYQDARAAFVKQGASPEQADRRARASLLDRLIAAGAPAADAKAILDEALGPPPPGSR